MKKQQLQRQVLDTKLEHIIADCTECGNCVKQCAFLQRFGTPAALARQFRARELDVETIYSCNLCRLCDVFCPEKLEPSHLFWLMRTQMVSEGRAPLKQHRRILNYERWGLSSLFQLSAIPDNAKTIFFPGCALAGSRPNQTLQLYEMLREEIGDLGIVLSCCAKPSHDLGRTEFFDTSFGKMMDDLRDRGIDSIITACPSCQQIFQKYGAGFSVKMIYELLADGYQQSKITTPAAASVHDPCSTRFDTGLHDETRKLVSAAGIDIKEMKHRGKRTYCCGEGGSACFIAPSITGLWADKRGDETAGRPVLTYCAGCVEFFSRRFKTIHILDLLLDPDRAMAGDSRVSRTPFTYLNRLHLKWKLRRMDRK